MLLHSKQISRLPIGTTKCAQPIFPGEGHFLLVMYFGNWYFSSPLLLGPIYRYSVPFLFSPPSGFFWCRQFESFSKNDLPSPAKCKNTLLRYQEWERAHRVGVLSLLNFFTFLLHDEENIYRTHYDVIAMWHTTNQAIIVISHRNHQNLDKNKQQPLKNPNEIWLITT